MPKMLMGLPSGVASNEPLNWSSSLVQQQFNDHRKISFYFIFNKEASLCVNKAGDLYLETENDRD